MQEYVSFAASGHLSVPPLSADRGGLAEAGVETVIFSLLADMRDERRIGGASICTGVHGESDLRCATA